MFQRFKRDHRAWACILLNGKTRCVEDITGDLVNHTCGLRGTWYGYERSKEDAIREAHEHFVWGYCEDINYYEKDGFIIQGEIDDRIDGIVRSDDE